MQISKMKLQMVMAEAEVGVMEVSRKSGLPPQTINRIMRNGTAGTAIIGKLAHALGVGVVDLVPADT